MKNSISKRFANALQQARKSPTYWIERTKLSFSVSLEQRRKACGLTYSELAQRLETSPAYVTKIFRGDSNLTIETMVKLAQATNSELEIQLVPASRQASSWDLAARVSTPQVSAAAETVVVSNFTAANHGQFGAQVAA